MTGALRVLPLVAAVAGSSSPVVHAHASVPPPPLPALPVIARVRIDVAKDRVLVEHEIVMSRGAWAGGDLDLWVSFGPTMPRAFDARLLAVKPGAAAPEPDDTGEPIATDKAAHRPAHVHPLLGRSTMAGEVLHVREPAFRRATAASGVLALRIRQVLPPPEADAQGAHEIELRLGLEGGPPLTVRRIDLTTSEPAGWMSRAQAELCGPNADPYALGFATSPRGAARTPFAIDPALATRHSTDELCVRWVAN
ncbi:MAG TPA: hypothetical protein VGH28_30485 [Polyangiaceae bacterium]